MRPPVVVQCFPRRVQEQENQKQQLCEELEQLKAPQDSREASCQTPATEEEVGDTRSREDGRPRASSGARPVQLVLV